jgi:hypothetical protein
MTGLTDPARLGATEIPHAEVLIRFADAAFARDEQALHPARQAVIAAMGTAAMVDAAGVVSNFQRMVRIADSTGIPVDAAMQVLSQDLREELGINRYVAAANTRPPGLFTRLLVQIVAVPLFRRMMRRANPPRG